LSGPSGGSFNFEGKEKKKKKIMQRQACIRRTTSCLAL